MLKNYLLLTLRNISRQKITSLIAILGLSLGITSALLLYTYIDYQLSYEDFMPENNSVKKLLFLEKSNYRSQINSAVTLPSTSIIKNEVSSIKRITYADMIGNDTLSINNDLYTEGTYFVEKKFFDLIPLDVIKGEKDNLLKKSHSIVLDKILAKKHFPSGNAIGEEIILHENGVYPLKITGVVDIPQNSHLYEENGVALIPNTIREFIRKKGGYNTNWRPVQLYFETIPDYDEDILKEEFANLLSRIPPISGYTTEEFFYEDFDKLHLSSKTNFKGINNPIFMIFFLVMLTLSILAISIINTVSILITQSMGRTREVGVRLVMGSGKKDLVFQFLTESIILAFLSLITALVFTELLRPAFSNIVLIELKINYSPTFIIYMAVLTLLVGIIAGLYPAFYLSSLKIVESLKGKKLLKLGKAKKLLLIIQFLCATILLIWSLTINNEIKYIQKLDPGFDYDKLLTIEPEGDFDKKSHEKISALKNELKLINGIEDVSNTFTPPFYTSGAIVCSYSTDNGITEYFTSYNYIDIDFFNVLGIKPIKGEIKNDSVVIFKSISKKRDIDIGDLIEIKGKTYTISAIIDDFHLRSRFEGSSPRFHIVSNNNNYYQVLKLSREIDIEPVRDVYESIYPGCSIQYQYVKDSIEMQNNPIEVQIVSKVVNLTVFIVLFLSILGLYGQTKHLVIQKTKEIGIRKVMGAGFINIIFQIPRESLIQIISGTCLGAPIGYFSIKFLLVRLGFYYQVHNLIPITIFSTIAIIVIGTMFIGTMVFNTARLNPSAALRYE